MLKHTRNTNNIGLQFHKEIYNEQEPWRPPSRQAEFNGTDRLRLDARSGYQALAGNQGYFELKLN